MVASLQRNVLLSRYVDIFSWAHFLAPVFSLIFLAEGHSLSEISLIFGTIFVLTIFFFEIPTGFISDKWSRKNVLFISGTLISIGYIPLILSEDLWWYAFAQVICGIGVAFLSGTSESILYDSLKKLKRESEFSTLYGKYHSSALFILGVTSIVGAYLFTIDTKLPLVLCFLFSIPLPIIALFMIEPPIKREKSSLRLILKSLQLLISSKALIWATFFGLSFSTIFWVFHRSFIQPYIEDIGLSIIFFGVFFAGFRFIQSFGSRVAPKLAKQFSLKYVLCVLVLIAGILYLLLGLFSTMAVLILLFIFYFIEGAIRPNISDYIQQQISSNIRATVTSMINLVWKLFQGIYAAIFAGIVAFNTMSALFIIIGTFTILFIVILYLTYQND